MQILKPAPDKDAIALLEPFERLGLDRITLVNNGKANLAYEAHKLLTVNIGLQNNM